MSGKDQPSSCEQEADRIIRRAEQESHGVFSGAMQRLMQHAGLSRGDQPAPEDGVELWARRIGRVLGLIVAIILVLNIFTRWFF